MNAAQNLIIPGSLRLCPPFSTLFRRVLFSRLQSLMSTTTEITENGKPFDISTHRRAYCNDEEPFLLEEHLPSNNPLKLFDIWFKNVACNSDIRFEEVNAACVSTVSPDGQPSSRMVLMRSYDSTGFVFHTNYHSRKGKEIEGNNKVCLLFFWPKVHRQVRIEGTAERWREEDNIKYWNSRPVANRIGTKSSDQSTVIPSREFLLEKQKSLLKEYEEKGEEALSKPKDWGGLLVKPSYFEFWQGQSDRVHDRIVFCRQPEDAHPAGDGWFMKRLSP